MKDLKDLVPTSVVLVKGYVERVMVYSIGKDDQNKKLKDSSWWKCLYCFLTQHCDFYQLHSLLMVCISDELVVSSNYHSGLLLVN